MFCRFFHGCYSSELSNCRLPPSPSRGPTLQHFSHTLIPILFTIVLMQEWTSIIATPSTGQLWSILPYSSFHFLFLWLKFFQESSIRNLTNVGFLKFFWCLLFWRKETFSFSYVLNPCNPWPDLRSYKDRAVCQWYYLFHTVNRRIESSWCVRCVCKRSKQSICKHKWGHVTWKGNELANHIWESV